MDAFRVWAEIDLDALAHNLQVVRSLSGSAGIMLVVKADAYGHGAVAIAHHAVRCGVRALGVGTSSEALELREAGIRVPLLVLGTIVDEELAACLRHDIHIGLHSSDRANSLQRAAKRMGKLAKVHLNVDTGMGRLGVLPKRALALLAEVAASPELELCGVMTHVSADAGALDPATQEQLAAFDAFLSEARAAGLPRGSVHVANSTTILTGLGARYDMVRPGLAAYGAWPSPGARAVELEAVMSLRSRVVFLKDVPRGTPIGYGSTWCAPRDTRIATLPLGYNDGLPWRLGGRGEVLLAGKRTPIVGRVSMDYTTLDVGHLPGVRTGDIATVLGRDGSEHITLEDMADLAGTIPYEISCSIGKRVARQYVGGETILSCSEPNTPVSSGRSVDSVPSV